MKDIFEEFKRVAGGPGAEVGDALRLSDAAATSRAIVAGRRRRVAAEGAVAAVALGAVVLGGWGLTEAVRGDAAPASIPTFTEDGAVSVYPELYDGALCDQDKGYAGAYVPFGEQGVHFYGPAADELDLKVTGTLASVSAGGNTELARGEHDFSEPNGDNYTMPEVQFYASWDGDARLSIRAAGYLVVNGWTITLPWQSNTDLFSAQPWIDNPVPSFDDAEGRSTIAASNVLDTFCIIPIEDGLPVSFVHPGGPAEVHTVVQVMDESGVVIAQYFDALDADGSVITFDALKDEPGAVTLPKVTDADIQRTIDARAAKAQIQEAGAADGAVTVGSAANGLDAALADSGKPLAAVGSGYTTRTECSARTEAVAADGDRLRVVPGDAEVPPVPSIWHAAAFAGEYGQVPIDEDAYATYSDNDWYIGHEIQVFFTDPNDSSDIKGQVTGLFAWNAGADQDTSDPTTGVFVFPAQSPCDDTAALAPGAYHVIVAVDGAPDGVREQYGSQDQFAQTFFDYGTITISE